MTIAVPTSGGWTFEATLEADEWHMVWLNSPNQVTGKRQGRCLLTAVLTIGWRIVESTPDERALLEAQGLDSRRVQGCAKVDGLRDGGCVHKKWGHQRSIQP